MLFWVWLKGILMGLAIAAPVGPIALLCIRRTLAQGRLIGLLSGLGAASADGLYGIVAAFGLTAISNLLIEHTTFLQMGGGLFLCYLGLTTFFATPSIAPTALDTSSDISSNPSLGNPGQLLSRKARFAAYTSTLALTLTNPATILSFFAIFAGLGITETAYLNSVTLVFGVFTGSALWWLVLVSGVVHLRNRLTPRRLLHFNRWLSRVFGLLICGFGMAAFLL